MPIPTPEPVAPPWRYRILVLALSPLLIGYTAWRACKDGGWRYFRERLGWYAAESAPRSSATGPDPAPAELWIHAASVGEVFTVLPLLKAWLTNNPNAGVRFTTGTPTGAAVLEQQQLTRVQHQYLPVDFSSACKRFVSQCTAGQAWIVETEIWPWLYAHCHRQNIAITIINGRLSARTSTQANGLLASSYRRALSHVNVLARSTKDHDRFLALGAPASSLQVAGNLKYSAQDGVRATAALVQRPYVLAASTHHDEELTLALAWHDQQRSDALLVCVPRHPERGDDIQRLMKSHGIDAGRRSQGDTPAPEDNVYLADTLGELQAWYEHAQGTFVGGSLITRGGHNMLEPARYACPAVVGPHTDNFEDMMELLLGEKAVAIASNAQSVVDFLAKAAQGDSDLQAMGRRAERIASDAQNALARYLDLLAR